MTNEPFGEEIPELVEQLEGTLNAPSVEAMHAGLGRRQAARKRMLSAAGAFAAVLAIAGGAIALTVDRASTTATATADEAGATSGTGESGSVADDSAPRLLDQPLIPDLNPFETTVLVGDCDSGSRLETDGSDWVTGQLLPTAWEGREEVPVTALLQGDALIAIDADDNATRFWRVAGLISPQCPKFGDPASEPPSDLAPSSHTIAAATGDVPLDDVSGSLTMGDAGDQQGQLEFSSQCRGGAGYWMLWGDAGFAVVDKRPQPAIETLVSCEDPPPRLELFEKGDAVAVTVSPDFIVLAVSGATEWRLVLTRVAFAEAALPATPTSLPTPLPETIVFHGEATVVIEECANGSSISVQGKRWFAEELPTAWQGQEQLKVTVEINGNSLIARDIEGNSAHFWDYEGMVRRLPCLGFTLDQTTTTVPVETTTTTAAATTIPLVEPSPWTSAVLATDAEFDSEPGAEQIWLEHDGSIHVGDLVGSADLWEISDFWFAEQAELFTVPFDGSTNAVVLALPERGDEDPRNVYQIFVADRGELRRIFSQAIGAHYQSQLEFNGDGTVSYVEDGFVACRRNDFEATIVVRQEVTLAMGDAGMLDVESRQDTTEQQNCDQLAG